MALKTTMSVSVAPEFAEDIGQRANELGYASRSEYVRDLVREDMENDIFDTPEEDD